MGLICFSGEKLLSVDDETKKKRKERVRGFSQSLFVKRREFEVLKNFCTKYGIKQADLVVVFTSYLSTHEAHLREFRVKILDLKVKFLKHSKLEQVFSINIIMLLLLNPVFYFLRNLPTSFSPQYLCKTFKVLVMPIQPRRFRTQDL